MTGITPHKHPLSVNFHSKIQKPPWKMSTCCCCPYSRQPLSLQRSLTWPPFLLFASSAFGIHITSRKIMNLWESSSFAQMKRYMYLHSIRHDIFHLNLIYFQKNIFVYSSVFFCLFFLKFSILHFKKQEACLTFFHPLLYYI